MAADSAALALARTLASYDGAIQMLDGTCGDKTAMSFLSRRRHDLVRIMRNANPEVHRTLEEERSRAMNEMHAMHRENRAADQKRHEEAEEKKAKEAQAKAEADERRAKRKRLEDIALGTDREWKPHDFGTAEQFTKQHVKNMQEALQRLHMRAPALPEELEARWPHFLETWPQTLRSQRGPTTGATFLHLIRYCLHDLGSHAVENPALKTKRPRTKEEGDTKAFEKFVREHTRVKLSHAGALML